MSCLADDLLAALAEGKIPTGEADAAWAHLATCDRCASVFDDLSAHLLDAKPATTDARDEGSFGRYELVRCLGQGGMGTVYLAFDPVLCRRVALKVVTHADAEPATRASFLREAQALARVTDAHVTTVHDVGVVGSSVFFAMEYVDGTSLADWLLEPRSWRAVVEVFLAAGAGLVAVHRAGLVHRDFKPSNVLLGGDGRVKVSDFGVARDRREPSDETVARRDEQVGTAPLAQGSLTRKGLVAGTVGYIAPEQLTDGIVTAAGDQFSFCVALYEALERRLPFGGLTTEAYERELRRGPLPFKRDVPRWLERAVLRGLSLNPAERFVDLEALLGVLRFELDGRRLRRVRAFQVGAVAALLVLPWAWSAAGEWRARRACEHQLGELSGDLGARWAGLRQRVCREARPEAIDCLKAWHRGYETTTEFLAADALRAARAREAVSSLGVPERCVATRPRLPVTGAVLAARLATATHELELARSSAAVGLEEARHRDDPPLLVEALLARAAVEPPELALTLAHEARLVAVAANEGELVVAAAVAEAPLLPTPEERADVVRLAAAFAERAGPRSSLETELLLARAMVAELDGDLEAAANHWEALGSSPRVPDPFTARRRLVELRARQGRHGEARRLLEVLIRDERNALGATHPDVVADEAALGATTPN